MSERSVVPISVRCSPDADDLFMFRALLEGQLETGRYRFRISTAPTDALNRTASQAAPPDVLALSAAHYPAVAHDYQLLPHGGSLGEGYGPVVVTREPRILRDLVGSRVGVPGTSTTAWMVLRLAAPRLVPVVVPIVPYSAIFDALRARRVDAGLLIHEGRLTFVDEGFHQAIDLGEWWAEHTRLPLPLGCNAIRRDLGGKIIREVSALLRQSIRHGLEHREEAIAWLLERGGPLRTRERISRYLDMYANQRTLDYGTAGRAAFQELYRRALDAGLIRQVPPVDFAP